MLLTAAALGLTTAGPRPLGLLLFLFASLTIGTGLVGLLLHAKAERLRRETESPAAELHLYRRADCDVDRVVVEKLAKGIGDLRQKIADSFPKLVPESFVPHFDRGQTLLRENDFPAAFREFCRAMHELARSYNSVRTKSEMFQPVWEKKRKKL